MLLVLTGAEAKHDQLGGFTAGVMPEDLGAPRLQISDGWKPKLSHFSTTTQSELFDTDSGTIRVKFKKCRALSSPPLQRPYGIRAYKTPARPSWGLFHLRLPFGRLVPQFDLTVVRIAQNYLTDGAQSPCEGSSGSYERRPTWNGLSDPKTLSVTVAF